MQTANHRSDHCRANLQQREIRGQVDWEYSRSELLEREATQDVQEQVVMYTGPFHFSHTPPFMQHLR